MKKALKRKYDEEALDRKAKAGIQANNYNCSVRMFKNFVKKESLSNKSHAKNVEKFSKQTETQNSVLNVKKRSNINHDPNY